MPRRDPDAARHVRPAALRTVTRDMIQDVKETVMANLPEGVHVLVKSGDIKLHVVALEDA